MTITITIGWWMIPFALVPALIVASVATINSEFDFDDFKGALSVTAVFWLFMAAARWMP